jgi:hypothetical protein
VTSLVPLPLSPSANDSPPTSGAHSSAGPLTLAGLFFQALADCTQPEAAADDPSGVVVLPAKQPKPRREERDEDAPLLGSVPVGVATITVPILEWRFGGGTGFPKNATPQVPLTIAAPGAHWSAQRPTLDSDTTLLSAGPASLLTNVPPLAPEAGASSLTDLLQADRLSRDGGDSNLPGQDQGRITADTNRLPQLGSANQMNPAPQLAFAARVTESARATEDVRPSGAQQHPLFTHAHPAAALLVTESEKESGSRQAGSERLAQPPVFISSKVDAAESGSADTAEVTPVRTLQAEPPVQPAKPISEVSVRLTNEHDQRVDVRILERGGELRVAVTASDSHLAGGLRQEIPELVARLESSGLRTSTWHPGGSAEAVSAVSESRNTSADADAQDARSRGGAAYQQNSQGGQQERRSQGQPAWVEELQRGETPFYDTQGGLLGYIR